MNLCLGMHVTISCSSDIAYNQQFLKTLGILSAKCTVESITEELAKINNVQECMHAGSITSLINHFLCPSLPLSPVQGNLVTN